MKTFVIIFLITTFSFLTGCYTMVGVVDEEQTYSTNEIEDEEYSSSYFDEETEEIYTEEYQIEQNEVYYGESSVDFFTIFSEAFSGFVSSGALNVIIDLSSNSSSSNSDKNDSSHQTRNNSGSRNSDGR